MAVSERKEGNKVFALTIEGLIYVYNKQGEMQKWMNIKVPRAFSCKTNGDKLFCACADGIIRVFAVENLAHLLSLSKPPPLGASNQIGVKNANKQMAQFADAVACAIDKQNQKVLILYSDKMMFLWDLKVMSSISVSRSLYSHCGPIHDLKVLSNEFNIGLN